MEMLANLNISLSLLSSKGQKEYQQNDNFKLYKIEEPKQHNWNIHT